jgi:hypothetical protein
MDNPAARDIVETVRKISEMARKARSGEPTAEDYLRAISSDPVTKWFAELLSEKNEELEKEKQRVHQLTCGLRAWYAARTPGLSEGSSSEAELQLSKLLRVMKIVDC